MTPMTPGAGFGLGTTTSVICVEFGAFKELVLNGTIWMPPVPDCTTNAWLVTGSTATPPHKVSVFVVPFATVRLTDPTVPVGILIKAYRARVIGSEMETSF